MSGSRTLDLPVGGALTKDEMLELLACPVCDQRPRVEKRGELLVCTLKGHGFRIVDGVPQMLPEDVLQPDEVKDLLNER